MKVLSKFFVISIFLFTGINCKPKQDNPEIPEVPETPEIVILPESLTLEKEISNYDISVTSNVAWTVSSAQDWCTVSPTSGSATETQLKISVKYNYSGANRTATLTFQSGTYSKEYSVVQKSFDVNTPTGYALVWNDEFVSDAGKSGLPDTEKWSYETGHGDWGWGNNEIQNYVAGVSGVDTCALVSNGTLKIVARKKGNEVISIRMNTTDDWLYGYFEARLKLPQGKGTWPAMWLLPRALTLWPDDGEIDVMEEVGFNPNVVSSAIHCKAYNHTLGTQKVAEKFVATAESDFHIYALEWTSDFIRGYVDGEKYFEFPNDKTGNKDTWPFNTPFYLKFNLAWGGNWGGAQGVDESKLPATYEIDYVRVFQKK